MTPERRQQLARGLLRNELLDELFDSREAELVEEWKGTGFDEAERRENLYQQLKASDDARDFINARIREYAGDGETG